MNVCPRNMLGRVKWRLVLGRHGGGCIDGSSKNGEERVKQRHLEQAVFRTWIKEGVEVTEVLP